MTQPAPLAEIWRGEFLESHHSGHAVICGPDGAVQAAWGDPDAVILPRSSVKMIQALPLVASGAADRAGLSSAQLALACASHQGAPVHSSMVEDWLKDLGLNDSDLRCGPEAPRDRDAKFAMIRAHGSPCQWHNNCSGKHAGFLTLTKDLGAGPEYVDPAHPVQLAVREALEEVSGEASPGYGIDGCSAPNFATTMTGLARAMAFFANAAKGSSGMERAATRLTEAMIAHPLLVAGEGRACTALMEAAGGKAALKTGAEGMFIAILPEQGLGIAVKAADGATRAAESAIAALLVRLGVLERGHPEVQRRLEPVISNRAGLPVGQIRPAAGLL